MSLPSTRQGYILFSAKMTEMFVLIPTLTGLSMHITTKGSYSFFDILIPIVFFCGLLFSQLISLLFQFIREKSRQGDRRDLFKALAIMMNLVGWISACCVIAYCAVMLLTTYASGEKEAMIDSFAIFFVALVIERILQFFTDTEHVTMTFNDANNALCLLKREFEGAGVAQPRIPEGASPTQSPKRESRSTRKRAKKSPASFIKSKRSNLRERCKGFRGPLKTMHENIIPEIMRMSRKVELLKFPSGRSPLAASQQSMNEQEFNVYIEDLVQTFLSIVKEFEGVCVEFDTLIEDRN